MMLMSHRQCSHGTFGAVCASNQIATLVAMSILEANGNAFDAAAACAFTLQVVDPDQCGPGGESVALFFSQATGRIDVLCGQGVSPERATIEAFQSLGLSSIPSVGVLPAVTPGSIDAWLLLLRDYGTLWLEDILMPGISYALNGYPLSLRASARISAFKERFSRYWKSSAEIYLRNDSPYPAGHLLKNAALARTFERLVQEGRSRSNDRIEQIEAARVAARTGFVCEAIDRFVQQEVIDDFAAATGHTAFLSGRDIESWNATLEPAVHFNYEDCTIFKPGAWSQGPVMLQQFALFGRLGLRPADLLSSPELHVVTEAMKLSYADRNAFYGDSGRVPVPVDHLLSNSYNDERCVEIGSVASSQVRCGRVAGYEAHQEAFQRLMDMQDQQIPAMSPPSKCTVHFDVIDRWGNMVSATQSGGWLDDSPIVPELGFPLNTRGQFFSLVRGSPGALAPRRRPLTTLSPTIVAEKGIPSLAFGTPGADQQDQWSTIYLLRYLSGIGLGEANDLPLFHTRHLVGLPAPHAFQPKRLVLEETYKPEVVRELQDIGHDVKVLSTVPRNPGTLLGFGTLSAVRKQGALISAAGSQRWPYSFACAR
jgi:gamma-glutamyltranspeptidase/glutathione hydrolase